ncbi:MAG TPA: hypothetical protein VFT22_43555 [Kofleriaceae bacterium]|nr:hypothetical protein [Kofleriaceae bacterium]
MSVAKMTREAPSSGAAAKPGGGVAAERVAAEGVAAEGVAAEIDALLEVARIARDPGSTIDHLAFPDLAHRAITRDEESP